MNFGLRNSIGVRLLRLVFGCYLVITIVVTATQLYFEYSNVEKNVITELYNIGRSFEDGLEMALWNFDTETINSILQGIQKIGTVAGVKIIDHEGYEAGSTGFFKKGVSSKKNVRRILSNDIVAHEVTVKQKDVVQTYYEYKLDIIYEEELGEPIKEPIGFAYIYVHRDTVIGRFKNSLFLILINAVIKTTALWIIFLYFSRRLLSRPLSDLTNATSAFSGRGAQTDEVSNRLEKIAYSSNKNELQHLALSFLSMRESILEKIGNLNTLNHFAVALTQTNSQAKIYERLYYQLSQMFGISGAAVFNMNDQVIWKSGLLQDQSSPDELLLPEIDNYNLDVIRGRNEIVYKAGEVTAQDSKLLANIPLLYIPFHFGSNERTEMWLMGEINNTRLDEGLSLNDESASFLQVISNMVSATLTSISQRETIESQNKNLEKRVSDRTEELASANRELQHLALHDPLTQLPNRMLFNDRLNHMINVASRENRHFAIASIDLKEFKQINDNFGHDAGDAVLREIGQRFSSVLRKSDTLSRMGGDEFAAILAGDNIESSIDIVVSRLLSSLQDAIELPDGTSTLANVNIGVSLFPDHGTGAEVLFKYADIAMYQAKRLGKGYAIFDSNKNAQEKDYLQLMYELEHAISKQQLRLHYQPIVDLKCNRTLSFEALLRWEHPEKGMIPPGMFISHAERTALIKPITFWVIREACKQCVLWQKDGIEAAISVNLSTRIFTSPDLPEQLQSILTEFGLDPKRLKLEITESAAMSNPEKALSIITSFSEIGFTISIDDFGTGHSSLSYLTRLPIDELKIDKSFLLNKNESSQIVVQTIIELAHSLNLYVVAEGIEDEETLHDLVQKDCDAAQGYYICHPMEPLAIKEWYQKSIERGAFF